MVTLLITPISGLLRGLGFTASQSSTGWGGVASRAIDGNTSGKYTDNSCSHSGGNKNNWWKADFHKPYVIASVKIFNRNDCCQERINGAQVRNKILNSFIYLDKLTVQVASCKLQCKLQCKLHDQISACYN